MSGEAHIDGSVLDNHLGSNYARAGYGVRWIKGNLPDISRRVEGAQTVSRAEAEALRAAINQADTAGYNSVIIHTDSEENIRGLNGQHTVHADIWNQIDEVKRRGMTIGCVKIAAGNQAHDLAQQGAKQ